MADGKPGRRKLDKDVKKSKSLKILLNQHDEAMLTECAEYFKTSKAAILMTGLEYVYNDMIEEKKDNGAV